MHEAKSPSAEASIWAPVELKTPEFYAWQLGPLGLWIRRTDAEWQLAWVAGRNPLDERAVAAHVGGDPPPVDAELLRLASGAANRVIRLQPTLADRPIVVRPEHPFALLAGDEATFYVGSQLWVSVLAGPTDRMLAEVATYRMSDTWFGPSTDEGELCYSSRTAARVTFGEVKSYPARAVTRITLRNASRRVLTVERLKVPVLNLGLFRASNGRLLTQSLRVQCDDDGTLAVGIDDEPLDDLGAVELVADPRESLSGGFRRALGALIG
ncbi:MAG: hypothetical protein ACI9OJ_001371 [Myxococcota bacterium]